MASMVTTVTSKAQVQLQDMAAAQLMDNVADLTKTDVAADMLAKAAEPAVTQTTGQAAAEPAAIQDVAVTLTKEVLHLMVVVHQAVKTILQHLVQAPAVVSEFTAKGQVATAIILLGTAQTHQAVAAMAAQAAKEDTMDKTLGAVLDKVQTIKEAAHTAAAEAVQAQAGHLVQVMDIEVLYELYGVHDKLVVLALLHLLEHGLLQTQVTYNRSK
jgi:hypothetical protein